MSRNVSHTGCKRIDECDEIGHAFVLNGRIDTLMFCLLIGRFLVRIQAQEQVCGYDQRAPGET